MSSLLPPHAAFAPAAPTRPDSADTPARAKWSAQAYARLGWAVVAVGFGGFVAWAALAPLDGGVTADGLVTVAGYRKTVQHPSGGVIERILVAEGDAVRQGQVLAVVNASVAQAEAASASANLFMAQALQARLEAERDGLAAPAYPQPLREAAARVPTAAAALALQDQLLASRRQALQAELAGLREGIAGARAQLAGLQARGDSLRLQRAALAERHAGLSQLAQEDYVPRNRALEVQGALAQADGDLAVTLADQERTRRQIGELQTRLAQREQTWQQEVRTALADARRDAGQQAQRLAAGSFDVTHAEIRSPVSGRVVGLRLHTPGGVIRAGEPLMDILPDAQPLQIETRIGVDLIDRVQAGLPVELLFTAFNRSSTPRVDGVVTQVSPDRLIDEATQQPYYAARIDVPAASLQRLDGLRIQPGMPVQAFVRTGERSLLSYLFKPLLDRSRTAFGGE
ncbi:MAG: Type I secretion system membrane fusion protein PrsE [Paracidovorax wautersii]|uniref:Membrane fusion protein (MFP) family protein n=1 Tax=Paracidovorax wautersii TaxID=1177982 RepID=A0A7V8FNK8_9BURK|nr:MAG: Type I secretion system membrane fusion protein PrsE [Paracidovorax wautersii]